MPNWKELLDEVRSAGGTHDVIRRKYLNVLTDLTGRNTIVYYSGWLQKSQFVPPNFSGFSVDDGDKNGFMAAIHQMDRGKGLDLVLHTPGGSVAATESLVDYLRSMFGNDIRAIVPQLAMSAGTMIALSCSEIIMGKHSSLGPIDPQFGGIPAHGVIEEFLNARQEIMNDPRTIPVWQPIIAKYHPTFIGECDKAIRWSKQVAVNWLETGMFKTKKDAKKLADRVVAELGDHAVTLSHERHYSAEAVKKLGVKVTMLETKGNEKLQDAVLSVHHACIQTMSATNCYKLIENQNGVAFALLLTTN
jgi:hypothetical protein